LGVEQTASEKDLKKAYFKLIVKYHPDKIADFETNANAQQNFQEISHGNIYNFGCVCNSNW
jgi:DnaJ-class molecular chaperone